MKSFQEEPVNYETFVKWCDDNGVKIGNKLNQLIRKHLIDVGLEVKTYD